MEVASTLSWFEVFRPPKEEFPNWNAGTSMISKSQEETEVSERLEEKALEADMRRRLGSRTASDSSERPKQQLGLKA
jgi:hypothetical protein